MTIFPLEIPPGMVRPGTVYDARGRWYDGSLVRWRDGVLGPWDGWVVLERTDSAAVSAVVSDDGGAQTDETADANEDTADDVVLVPASPQVDDALYIGFPYRFGQVEVNVSTAASDGTLTWEYWNGSSWVALSDVVDNTSNFQSAGTNPVAWTTPSDWATTTVNSQGPYYYVRARVTGAGTTTALGEQIWVGDGPIDVDGPIRGSLAWRANSGAAYLGFGTHEKLFTFSGVVLEDVTPAGFTAGNVDATYGAGYGSGAYGDGPYGVGGGAATLLVEANTWQLDNYGEDMVAVAFSDGKLYLWDRDVGGLAAALSGAPTGNVGVVVTPERFIFALGAGGDPRRIEWADQDDSTDWTAAPNNQAGGFNLPGSGKILAGRRGNGETLIWTDADLFAARYTADEFVYRFLRLGSGAISRRAMFVVDGVAYWMDHGHFMIYDGVARELSSPMTDYVFGDLNEDQASKIWAMGNMESGEAIWFYPSAGSVEIDRYVAYNYRLGIWSRGDLERTGGSDNDVFGFPFMADASGVLYEHETGDSYLDPDGSTLTPFIESGPTEILPGGERRMYVRRILPDEKTLGDLSLTLKGLEYPTGAETSHGPFTAANPTSVRVAARYIRVRADQVNSGWRLGTVLLDAVPGGRR